MFPNRTLLVLFAGTTLLRAQTPAPAPASPAAPAPAAPAAAATTIDPRVKALVEEARKLQQQQRSFEALQKLDEADAILPGSAFIWNVRGSIYTAPPLRDYAKARECFEAAEKAMPAAFEPKFNKTELLYVEHKYAEAEAGFGKLLADFLKLREEVRHLIQFKIIVSQLKQGKVDEAKKSSAQFTFMDDTPAYYYMKAAFAFQMPDTDEAKKWVANAGKIFKPKENAVYLDSLMEAGWLPSIIAGDGGKK